MGKPAANGKNGASTSAVSRSSPIPSGAASSTTATARKTFNSTGIVTSEPSKVLRSTSSQQKHNENGNGADNNKEDPSQINFPYDIRMNGFSSLLTSVIRSTEKVRRLILEECELILECRVCRNLFRSLPNFIAHKESYCKQKYGPSSGSSQSNVLQDNLIYSDVKYHLDASSESEPASQQNVVHKKKPKLDNIVKKLTTSAENVKDARKSGILDRRDYVQPLQQESSIFPNGICLDDKPHILLHSLEQGKGYKGVMFQRNVTASSASAVFEGWANTFNAPTADSAILGADGRIICASDSTVIDSIVTKVVDRIGDQVEEKRIQKWELECDECYTIFPTRKTLRMHVRSAHRKQNTSDEELDHKQEQGESGSSAANANNSTKPAASVKNLDSAEDRIPIISKFSPQKLNTLHDCRTDLKQSRLLGTSLSRQRKRVASGSSCSNSSSDSGPSYDIVHGPNGICRKSEACYSESSRFICMKCSSKFSTVQETSAHKNECSGVINLIRVPSPILQEPRLTSILLRKDYSQIDSGRVKLEVDLQPVNSSSEMNGSSSSMKKRFLARPVVIRQSATLNGISDVDLSEEGNEDPCSADTCSNSSLESPDECMKSSDAEGETDRYSNVTDSGLSTSSSIPSQSTMTPLDDPPVLRTKSSRGIDTESP